jgi:hypothetical protein
MKTILLCLGFVLFVFNVDAQQINTNDEKEILQVLEDQRTAWNNGNIKEYMNGYWKSDSLKFIGKNGIRYGWEEIYKTYEKNYPDKEAMGYLDFEVISLEFFTTTSAFMIGKWRLTCTKDIIGGHFSLIWGKIKNQWLITADHSS